MTPSLDIFSPLVGDRFMVETLDGPMELVLVEAKEYPRKGLPEEFRTPLSLIFAGAPSPVLGQDNYYVDHPAMGRQVWCIVPISPSVHTHMSAVPVPQPTQRRYQVLFA